MKNKEFTLAIIVIIIFVAGYVLFRAPAGDIDEGITPPEGELIASGMTPVVDGDNVYSFEGIDWLFEPQGIDTSGAPVTKVRMQFVGFKRGDVDIDVLPYRLGNYRGECEVLESIEAAIEEDEAPLAFARCSYGETGREFGIFQKDVRVIAKYRDVNSVDGAMKRLTDVDLTKVVQ